MSAVFGGEEQEAADDLMLVDWRTVEGEVEEVVGGGAGVVRSVGER